MLSYTDVHYIVGLLCSVTNSDDVDIELGSLVHDSASESQRDVDVTVTYRGKDGVRIGLIGLEVKDLRRPMDVANTEALCQKFKDIPSIARGGIVSASGYSKAAKKKAKFHGVDLYHFTRVKDDSVTPARVTFLPGMPVDEYYSEWEGPCNVEFSIEGTGEPRPPIDYEPQVCNKNGDPIPQCTKLADLANRVATQVLNEFKSRLSVPELGKPEFGRIDVIVEMSDEPCALFGNELVPLRIAKVRGLIKTSKFEREAHLVTLTKEGDPQFRIACVISEMADGQLLGMAESHLDTGLHFVHIPMSDRLKKKILKQPLNRNLQVRTEP